MILLISIAFWTGLLMAFHCTTLVHVFPLTVRTLYWLSPYLLLFRKKINSEILAGRVAGPFDAPPLPNLRVSPIGLVPKKTPGEYRLIHHLSFPYGFSVNDFIDPKLASVQYTSFDEEVFMLQDLGKNCKLFKLDLHNPFRLLPVNKSMFQLLGFKLKDKFYIDKSLPFGCSISCRTFEQFSAFLEFAVKRCMKSGSLLHYLDDFLGGIRPIPHVKP